MMITWSRIEILFSPSLKSFVAKRLERDTLEFATHVPECYMRLATFLKGPLPGLVGLLVVQAENSFTDTKQRPPFFMPH